MTFEEMQLIIQQMLAVQRELQESQLRLEEAQLRNQEALLRNQEEIGLLIQKTQQDKETQEQMRQDINIVLETAKIQNRNIERLIGYSITNESEHLDIEERFRRLERRMQTLENNQP